MIPEQMYNGETIRGAAGHARCGKTMTPKERILAAIRREEVDYAPCVPLFWSSPEVDGYRWTTTEEKLEVLTRRLGVDAVLEFGIGIGRHQDMKERVWQEDAPDAPYPLLHKTIETPRGTLSAVVRRTDDWPHGDDIPLMSDFVVSRIVKPWIETEQDMDCFELVWQPPDDEDPAQRVAVTRALADKWQVPIRATVGYGLTASLSLFGAENAPLISVDKPELLERLAEIEHRVTMKRIELAARAGVDIVTRNGFYETTDFWSPAQIGRLLSARLKREIELAHQAGMPITYTICTGIMPIIEHLKALPFDCLYGIEPALGGQDMKVIARELGPNKCIWGGLSAPIHLGQGTLEAVREAVRGFYRDFGDRGTILAAVPSIRPHWPWENVAAMLDEWRKERSTSRGHLPG